MEKLLLGLLPTLMVVGGLYWTMTMGMREQEAADRFTAQALQFGQLGFDLLEAWRQGLQQAVARVGG